MSFLRKLLGIKSERVAPPAAKKAPTKVFRIKAESLRELARVYPSVDFRGFAASNQKTGRYHIDKLISAFEETSQKIGRQFFNRLRITLTNTGEQVAYVSDGTIRLNYEKFSRGDLVKRLLKMYHSQG